jgi:ubiquinone/menaquinone biosynthesis C-methylase UbiE
VPLPSDIYDREYFLSDRCEGYEYFRDGVLSLVKQYEIDQLRLAPGLRVLDAGCGRGEVLKAAAAAGAEVAGLDYSQAAVELTRETLAGVGGADVRHGDVTALPWPDGSFDRVLFGDVIEHLDPPQADVALREFERVLRPGGTVLVHTAPNRWFRKLSWPVLRPVMKLVAKDAAASLDHYLADVLGYHVNEQSLPSLRRLVRSAGYTDVEAWVAPDVLRSGSHRLTRGLDDSRMFSMAAKVASTRPLRLFLGNDLYARGTKR